MIRMRMAMILCRFFPEWHPTCVASGLLAVEWPWLEGGNGGTTVEKEAAPSGYPAEAALSLVGSGYGCLPFDAGQGCEQQGPDTRRSGPIEVPPAGWNLEGNQPAGGRSAGPVGAIVQPGVQRKTEGNSGLRLRSDLEL